MTEPSPKETLDTVSSEMHRRMRAMLAMVRSLTRRTARNAQSVEEFEQHLDGRLLALGRAQAFVMPGDEKRFDLELLVREEMLAYLQKDNGLITIEANDASRVEAVLRDQFQLQPQRVHQQVRLRVDSPAKLIPELVEALGEDAQSVSLGRPSLEDVFIAKTGQAFTP